jgi:hypothetical protein
MPIVNNREAMLAHILKNTQERARLKSRMCTITYNDLDNLCNNQKGLCALTGYTMSYTTGDPLKVSIDRIDSAKGYTLDNIQLVCRSVNRSKSNIDNNEFIAMCKAIASSVKEPK